MVKIVDWLCSDLDFTTVDLYFLELGIDRLIVFEIQVKIIDNLCLEQSHQLLYLFLLSYVRNNVHVLSIDHFQSLIDVSSGEFT